MIDAKKARDLSEDSVIMDELTNYLSDLGNRVLFKCENGEYELEFNFTCTMSSAFRRRVLHELTLKGFRYKEAPQYGYILSWDNKSDY